MSELRNGLRVEEDDVEEEGGGGGRGGGDERRRDGDLIFFMGLDWKESEEGLSRFRLPSF